MLYAVGTKRKEKHLGYAADFCCLCRSMQAFKINRVGLARHINFVTVSDGKLAGYSRHCMRCNTVYATELERYPTLADQAGPHDIATLIEATYPTAREQYAQRLELERSLREGQAQLPPQVRDQLLHEPFHVLVPALDERFRTVRPDGWMLGGMVVTIAATLAVIGVSQSTPFWREAAPAVLGGVVAGGTVGIVALGYRASREYLRKHIYPKLAATLKPLQPSEAELGTVLASFTRHRKSAAKRLKMAELMRYLKAA